MTERRVINKTQLNKTVISPPSNILELPGNRLKNGTFQPGKSGNPSGRPKHVGEIAALAREHSVEAIERLAEWMRTDNPKASIAACIALINRGYGMPVQANELSGPGGAPLQAPSLAINFVAVSNAIQKAIQPTIEAEQ